MAEAAATTEGTMAAARGPAKKVQEILGDAHPDVVLANLNSPKQTVISGPVPAVEAAVKALDEGGVMSVPLPVATAFHSPIVAGASKPYGTFLADLSVDAPTIPAWSNAEAAPYPTDADAIRTGLAEQIARPVRFVEMIEGMYADGVRTFVEVGPGSVLAGLVKRILRRKDHTAISTDRKGGDGIEAFFMALGALVADGRAMNLQPVLAEYRAAVDPSTVKKPRIAIPIDGTNVDKPYPPQLGASGRATPNPETTPEVKVVEKVVDRIVEKVVYKTVPATSHPSSAPAPAAPHSAAAVRSEVSMSNQNTPHPSVQLAWVTAWQETQQQTADAHSAFQRSMADSHAAFLKTAETSFMGLAAVLSGAGVPTVAHAAPQPVTLPSPVAVTPAPRIVPVAVTPAPRIVPVVAAPAPAPVVVPAPIVAPAPVAAPAPAAASRDLSALMLAVVAEKTGYPAEMLTLDMDLEGDLGVDSIKRVEILSAVQEKAPELAGIDASSLGALRTLGEIVEAMGGSTAAPEPEPEPEPEAAPAATGGVDLPTLMLGVVAEKTGYPAEMLTLDMDLEGDLGVDSIKRVEILSAVQEQAPELAGIDASSLGALRTLGEIVEAMGGASVSQAVTSSEDPAAGRYAPTPVAAPANGLARRGLPPA
jgi:acyl transferase domain-containing protein